MTTLLPNTLYNALYRALSVKRSSGSLGEAQFRAWLCKTYSHYLEMVDEAGNLWFKTTPTSKTLFAAHTDTCHHTEGSNPFTVKDGIVKAGAEVLGADDGAGVAILCHLMANNIPGTYLFTTSEEVGGIGAKYIADNFPDLLEQFDRSICFDRAGTEEMITVQGGQRCASKEFAEALSIEFEKQDLLYAESEKGVYTDNKEWAYHVMECVNLSCGYNRQHGPNENLDLHHFKLLADAALKIDWESLPTVRKAIRELDGFDGFNGFNGFNEFSELDAEASLFEAIEDWYRGGTLSLHKELAKELALRHNISETEAGVYINLNRLTEEWMEDLPYMSGNLALLDALIEKTTAN